MYSIDQKYSVSIYNKTLDNKILNDVKKYFEKGITIYLFTNKDIDKKSYDSGVMKDEYFI